MSIRWFDLGFRVRVEERFRLFGIDTPETRTKDEREKRLGKMAAKPVEGQLPEGSKHVINTSFDSRGSFGWAMEDFRLHGGGTPCELLVA